MLKILLIVSLFLTTNFSSAQTKSYSLEMAQDLQKQVDKPLLIFLHADWCAYCKAFLATTFKNNEVEKLIQEKFYFVKINTEEKKSIQYHNKTYHFQPTGYKIGIHEIVKALIPTNKTSNVPILLIKNSKDETLFYHDGYLKSSELIEVLNQF